MKRSLLVTLSLFCGALPSLSQAKEAGFCAAIRGNGELAMAHFPALARLVESYGPLQGAAGGSSATASIFISQSMLKNKLLTKCSFKSDEDQPKSVEDTECVAKKSLELSLLLKSVEGYVMFESQGSEAQAISKIFSSNVLTLLEQLYQKMKEPIDEKNAAEHQIFEAELQKSMRLFLTEVATIASSKRARSMINMDALKFVKESLMNTALPKRERNLQLRFRLKELIDSIKMIGKFNARDSNLFLRRGIINFDGFAKISGELADFYAGYLPREMQNSEPGYIYQTSLKSFLSCSSLAKGKMWQDIMTSTVPGEETLTCGKAFFTALATYKSAHESFPIYSIEEPISNSSIPVLVSTGLLTKDAVAQYHAARRSYDAHIPNVNLMPSFRPQWEDIKFGYFGEPSLLDHVGLSLPQDEKSHKFYTLGDSPWKDILAISPAEPGLSPAKAIPGYSPDDILSIGGWSDLHPVLVLKALPSCERVVYITRKGGETKFGQGVATQLGLENWVWKKVLVPDEKGKYPHNDFGIAGEILSHWGHLYNLANPDSSFSTSLRRADAVYCTDWDSYTVSESQKLIKHSYIQSPLFVQSRPYMDEALKEHLFEPSYFLGSDGPEGLSPIGDDLGVETPYIHEEQWQDYPGCVLQPF